MLTNHSFDNIDGATKDLKELLSLPWKQKKPARLKPHQIG